MTAPLSEDELRAALAERAASVPEKACIRLRQLDYQPRRHTRVRVMLIPLVLAVAGACAFAVGSITSSSPGASSTVRLASFTFALPAAAHVTGTGASARCRPDIRSSVPRTVAQSNGVFTAVNGGCLNVDLKSFRLPAEAVPVAVGRYQGFVVSDPSAGRFTLYVRTSATSELVFTSIRTGLTAKQLIMMARSGLLR
jgi:hypothetical protein